jgi:Ribbon-helix-helix protein, copG family
MKKSIKVMPKRRGRPATGKDPQVILRMPPDQIKRVEAWAKLNKITRSEAIRRLLDDALQILLL